MTVPQGNLRFSCNVGRIRSSVPLRPTFEDDETWYCGTAIAVPYIKLHKHFDVTAYYRPLFLTCSAFLFDGRYRTQIYDLTHCKRFTA